MNINQTLNGFTGYLSSQGGVAHLNRFLVEIPALPNSMLKNPKPSYKNVIRGLQFTARSANLPSKTISTSEVGAAGPEQKYPYMDVYEDLTVTILATKGKNFPHLPERLFFEDWISTVVNNGNMLIGFSDGDDGYGVPLTLSVLSDQRGSPARLVQYQFDRSYPIGIGAMEFSHDSEELMTFEVTFSYDKWYRNSKSGENTNNPIPEYVAKWPKDDKYELDSSKAESRSRPDSSTTVGAEKAEIGIPARPDWTEPVKAEEFVRPNYESTVKAESRTRPSPYKSKGFGGTVPLNLTNPKPKREFPPPSPKKITSFTGETIKH